MLLDYLALLLQLMTRYKAPIDAHNPTSVRVGGATGVCMCACAGVVVGVWRSEVLCATSFPGRVRGSAWVAWVSGVVLDLVASFAVLPASPHLSL